MCKKLSKIVKIDVSQKASESIQEHPRSDSVMSGDHFDRVGVAKVTKFENLRCLQKRPKTSPK